MQLNKSHARQICPSVEYIGVHSAKSIKLGDKNVIDPTLANIIMEILENTSSPQCGILTHPCPQRMFQGTEMEMEYSHILRWG